MIGTGSLSIGNSAYMVYCNVQIMATRPLPLPEPGEPVETSIHRHCLAASRAHHVGHVGQWCTESTVSDQHYRNSQGRRPCVVSVGGRPRANGVFRISTGNGCGRPKVGPEQRIGVSVVQLSLHCARASPAGGVESLQLPYRADQPPRKELHWGNPVSSPVHWRRRGSAFVSRRVEHACTRVTPSSRRMQRTRWTGYPGCEGKWAFNTELIL
ncbi:hypothetical protein BD413DRAFT_552022 [Trametes elegans]|nr:hypothetical protein BD413DRAFT_552022 [Trametes elegans]